MTDLEHRIRRRAFQMARYSRYQARRLYKLAEEAGSIRDVDQD